MRNAITLLFLVSLTGCASSSPQSCSFSSWQAFGASSSTSSAQLEKNSTSSGCGTGVSLAYRAGVELGLEQQCTFEQGLLVGEQGGAPVKACDTSKWDRYQEGFLAGREIYVANQRLELISSQLKLTKEHLLDAQYSHGSGALAASEHARINQLRGDIADLVSKKDSENRRLISLQYQLRHQYESNLGSY